MQANFTPENSISITILYFASLADKAKKDEETLTIDQNITLSELYSQLAKMYGFTLTQHRLGVAVNHEFCDWDTSLQAGDIVAFIPPVAGG